jgi:hypothetical protein
MNDQRQAIREALLGTAEVAAITTRVYSGKASLSAPTPYIIIRLAGVERPRTHDMRDTPGRRKADQQTWEVVCVAEDGDVADALGEAVDNALDGKTVINDTAVLLFDDASDVTDFKQDQSGTILHQMSLMFLVRRRPQ